MIIPADTLAVMQAIQHSRYECNTIVDSRYTGQNRLEQEFDIVCSGQQLYHIAISRDGQFRVWKKPK
jgi:hypothetical protein